MDEQVYRICPDTISYGVTNDLSIMPTVYSGYDDAVRMAKRSDWSRGPYYIIERCEHYEVCGKVDGDESSKPRMNEGRTVDKRKYIAISIKHTIGGWKFGNTCVLWGYKRTKDEEPRCFSDYTIYPMKAERYAIGDFRKHGYEDDIKDDAPVPIDLGFIKRWREYDTVLVDEDQYIEYCKMCCLPLDPPGGV